MTKTFLIIVFFLTDICFALVFSSPEKAGEVYAHLLSSELEKPLWACVPKNVQDEIWILEKRGRIQILNRKTGKLSLFLDITNRVTVKKNEQGLLGMAFDKNYLKNGRFYLNYSNLQGNTVIARYTAQREKMRSCKPESEEILMTIKQPAGNHNGGWIAFGPDNYLYIGMGDGGRANDPWNNSQNLNAYLGKLLRIDASPKNGYHVPPDNPFLKTQGAKAEIYAYGLRNPWRCSWDRKTKDFYIGDVGQNKWEEINFIPAGKGKGANYGWRLREAHEATPLRKKRRKKTTTSINVGGPKPKEAIDPVYYYGRGTGAFEGFSVTGGYVYRGPIKKLQGKYFFADYANPRIWSLEMKDGKLENIEDWTDRLNAGLKSPIRAVASFAEDNEGNLLIISLAGNIYQIAEK